jgi:hypothetical protein
METAMAQIGATFLRHIIENSAQQDQNSPLLSLLKNPSSLTEKVHVTERQVNTSETSKVRAASAVTHRPDSKAYISRVSVNRNLTFTQNDLFRKDDIVSLRDQYLRWRHICVEDGNHDALLDRIVSAFSRLNTLKDEGIGSIPLEMTYFSLFFHYQRYRCGQNHVSPKNGSLCDTILHQVFGEDWDHFNDATRQRHQNKLSNQLIIGRRWSVAVDRLSHGVLFLAGKKIPSLM